MLTFCRCVQFAIVNTVHTTIIDMFPDVFHKGHRRSVLMVAICGVCFLLGLVCVTRVRPAEDKAAVLTLGQSQAWVVIYAVDWLAVPTAFAPSGSRRPVPSCSPFPLSRSRRPALTLRAPYREVCSPHPLPPTLPSRCGVRLTGRYVPPTPFPPPCPHAVVCALQGGMFPPPPSPHPALTLWSVPYREACSPLPLPPTLPSRCGVRLTGRHVPPSPFPPPCPHAVVCALQGGMFPPPPAPHPALTLWSVPYREACSRCS